MFATLSIFRPVLHILPNITHLTWRRDPTRPATSLKLCLLFLAPGLKTLTVQTGLDPVEGDLFAIGNFFQEVVGRCPNLECIDFRSEITFRDMGPMLPQFLASFTKLKTVSLPEGLICSDVVTALATLPRLEVVCCTTPILELPQITNHKRGVLDLENFIPYVGQDGFQSIRTLQLTAHLWNVTHFLHSIPTVSRLRELVVKTLTLETAENVEGFFTVVAIMCPGIEILSLSVQYSRMQEFRPLHFSSIAPLLACGSLADFSIESPSMLDIDDAEAISMASSWPRLRNLHLNPLPVPQAFEHVHMTFISLIALAEHCPNLHYLGLCIRASFVPPPEERRLLSRLKTTVLGLRDMDYDQDTVALFLADILPPTCTPLSTQLFPILSQVDRTIRDHFSHSQWKAETTLKKVPMLRKFHAKYKERLQALEGEVQRLTIASAKS